MPTSRNDRRSPRSSALRALITLSGVLSGLASPLAHAACLPSSDKEIQQYEQRIGTDPNAVAQVVTARLEAGHDTDPVRKAALNAVLGEALSALERYEEVRAVAQRGFALLPDKRNPIYVNLLNEWAANSYDEDGVRRAIVDVEAARKVQTPNSPAEACMLIALGQLEHQADRVDQASIYLTRAYRMSSGIERTRQRVLAADTLAIVMRDLRDFSQALALNKEVIDSDIERGATFNLATSRFMRGAILREMGDYKAAIAEFDASRAISLQMSDTLGVAYDDLLLCTSNVELGELKAARAQCTSALEAFSSVQSVEPQKQAFAALAQIDLAEGNAAAALMKLNRVLDKDGRDLVARRLAQVYELRARTYAALGQHQKALEDYKVHMQRSKAAIAAEKASEAAALRARFETDREIERNTFLQRELEIQNERLAAQSDRLRLLIVAAVAGACMIALLTYLLLINRKQKQMLVRIALQDDLTELPNRRRTLELAGEAFEQARRDGTPLTIGLIDLDHFKLVNDRFGHAVGDFVLQEFARLSRRVVRDTDVVGRWGGEEFLILLPDTTLDVGLAIVERVREEALKIKGGTVADDLRVSLSAGLATNEGNPAHLEEIIASADAALYDAKKGGRDLVCVAPESYSLASSGVRRVLKDSGIELATGTFERRVSAEQGRKKNK
jgi:diguanylate cyclase (GGDEF)-like protein